MSKKLISIVTPCYNEESNVREVWAQVKIQFEKLPDYDYEHIFIDNSSKDKTVAILKELAELDKRVKVIVNARNFGQIKSPFYGLLQAKGDAVILFVADLQDPPAMIVKFIAEWEKGYKIVAGIKETSEESKPMFLVRKIYYGLIFKLSEEVELINNFTGFGLYDREVMDIIKNLNDPYPYLRGMVSEVGFDVAKISYQQPTRKRGITSNNFYRLYDFAMLGITSHTKKPLRYATISGFILSIVSFLIALVYGVYKLIYWDRFEAGTAPLVIGLFFMFSVQLFFMGLLGEYILSIHQRIMNRPLVIEKERVNFD
jgi:glycosyltransferase involved in cell wall biosynthesis